MSQKGDKHESADPSKAQNSKERPSSVDDAQVVQQEQNGVAAGRSCHHEAQGKV